MFLIFCTFLCLVFSDVENVKIWPYPALYKETDGGVTLNFDEIDFSLYDSSKKQNVPISSDDFMSSLVKRYEVFLYQKQQFCSSPQEGTSSSSLPFKFSISNLNHRTIDVHTNESYNLQVNADGVILESETIFGALRGIETFTQLVSNKAIEKTPILVIDTPRYAWRGIMIDVSRHYLKVSTLKKIIDGMSYNKFNNLHIHLTDAQSFPVVIESYPKLSEEGSYDPEHAIFTSADLKDLVSYANERGIWIIPEVDVPGHAYSWGKGYPSIVADCPAYSANINNIPLDPTNDLSIKVMETIVDELGDIFPDEHFHIGGDEVVYGCWEGVDHIDAYMKKYGLTGADLQGMFMNQIINYTKKSVVIWQELAQNIPPKYPISRDEVLVEVWQNPEDLLTLTTNGYTTILSAGWYFDRMEPRQGEYHYLALDVWMDMWSMEPESFTKESLVGQIKGGEGCMWGEQINDHVAVQRIFPKACAVAERLWSPKSLNLSEEEIRVMKYGRNSEESINSVSIDVIQDRLMHHICHNLLQRGVESSSLRPDFCPDIVQ